MLYPTLSRENCPDTFAFAKTLEAGIAKLHSTGYMLLTLVPDTLGAIQALTDITEDLLKSVDGNENFHLLSPLNQLADNMREKNITISPALENVITAMQTAQPTSKAAEIVLSATDVISNHTMWHHDSDNLMITVPSHSGTYVTNVTINEALNIGPFNPDAGYDFHAFPKERIWQIPDGYIAIFNGNKSGRSPLIHSTPKLLGRQRSFLAVIS